MMPYSTTVPTKSQKPKRCYIYTHRQLPPGYGEMVSKFNTHRRRPGILDRISTCDSKTAAQKLFTDFFTTATSPSRKTERKAARLLETLDFPLP